MNKRYKIFHIHGDSKFIDSTQRFDNPNFDNQILVFKLNRDYKGILKDRCKYFELNINGANQIIEICRDADMVIVYALENFKSYVVNRLPENVIVLWRFFGHELYNLQPKEYLSKQTYNLVYGNFKSVFNNLVTNIIKISSVTRYVVKKFHNPFLYEFEHAVKRADFFLGISKLEYEKFKKVYNNLPPFLRLSISTLFPIYSVCNKEDVIILGHSRSVSNNHIDILDDLINSEIQEYPKILIPYNYGTVERKYTEVLYEKSKKINNIEFVETFLDKNDYFDILKSASTFVFNHYKQMAGANIIIGLNYGIKIYFNEKNILYHQYKSEGFFVFLINDLVNDIKNNNIKLSEEEALHNREQYIKLTQKYNSNYFTDSVLNIFKSSKTHGN